MRRKIYVIEPVDKMTGKQGRIWRGAEWAAAQGPPQFCNYLTASIGKCIYFNWHILKMHYMKFYFSLIK